MTMSGWIEIVTQSDQHYRGMGYVEQQLVTINDTCQVWEPRAEWVQSASWGSYRGRWVSSSMSTWPMSRIRRIIWLKNKPRGPVWASKRKGILLPLCAKN